VKFSNAAADVYVPSGSSPEVALKQTTHLCVAAHQDDIEIMAYSGITECFESNRNYFTGVVVTNGSGSPRTGDFTVMTDVQMQHVRKEEQRKAADIGKYNLQIQLAHPSSDIKVVGHTGVASDLKTIFAGCLPDIVYLHNPADKHETHIAVLLRCITAIRSLPASKRPKKVLGCEVWRDLDWLSDSAKVALDASQKPEMAAGLLNVFESQIKGGKRYDLATLGRRVANATFHTSHQTDKVSAIVWAMDLTPVVNDLAVTLESLVTKHIDDFKSDVSARIARLSGF
jgi:LmbE family N-acetylglucosaminyl deacetylase